MASICPHQSGTVSQRLSLNICFMAFRENKTEMSFWGGATLKDQIPRLNIVDSENFDAKRIDCAAYTLRMGAEAYVTPDYQVGRLSSHTKIHLENRQHFIIPPGQFAFLLTEEFIKIPPHVLGFISLRTRYK